MQAQTLTETEVHGVIVNAMHSAARTYRELAAQCSVEENGAMLAEVFNIQAQTASAMAERIEQASCIVLMSEPE